MSRSKKGGKSSSSPSHSPAQSMKTTSNQDKIASPSGVDMSKALTLEQALDLLEEKAREVVRCADIAEALIGERDQLQKRLEDTTQDLESLTATHRQCGTASASNSTSKSNSLDSDRIHTLTTSNDNLKREVEKAEKRLRSAEERSVSLEAKNGKLKSELSQLESTISTLRKSLADTQAQSKESKAALQVKIDDLQSQLDILRRETARGDREEAGWQSKYERLVTENTQVTQSHATLTNDHGKLTKAHTEQGQELTSAKETIASLKTSLSTLRRSLEDKLSLMAEDKADTERELTASLDDARQARSNLQAACDATAKDRDAIRQRLQECETELAQAEEKATGANREMGEWKSRCAALEQQVASASSEDTSALSSVKTELAQAQQAAAVLLNERDDRSAQLEAAQQQLAKFDSQLTALREKSIDREDHSREVDTLNKKIQSQEQELQSARDELQDAHTRVIQLETDLDTLQEQTAGPSMNRSVILEAENKSLAAALKDTQSELDLKRRKLTRALSTNDERLQEIRDLQDALAEKSVGPNASTSRHDNSALGDTSYNISWNNESLLNDTHGGATTIDTLTSSEGASRDDVEVSSSAFGSVSHGQRSMTPSPQYLQEKVDVTPSMPSPIPAADDVSSEPEDVPTDPVPQPGSASTDVDKATAAERPVTAVDTTKDIRRKRSVSFAQTPTSHPPSPPTPSHDEHAEVTPVATTSEADVSLISEEGDREQPLWARVFQFTSNMNDLFQIASPAPGKARRGQGKHGKGDSETAVVNGTTDIDEHASQRRRARKRAQSHVHSPHGVPAIHAARYRNNGPETGVHTRLTMYDLNTPGSERAKSITESPNSSGLNFVHQWADVLRGGDTPRKLNFDHSDSAGVGIPSDTSPV